MKKTVLFSFFLLSICIASFAQNETKKLILIQSAKILEQESRATYSAAIIKAKEKGWPIFYKSKNNSRASLVGINEFGQPKYLVGFADPVHAITVNTNLIWPGGIAGLNLSGSNDSLTNKLGIWDEGKSRITHYELAGRVTQKDNATNVNDHSTHTLGIMINSGVNPMAKGMSYGIKGTYAYDWNNDASEMAAAAANGMLISNHSYGVVAGWDYNYDSTRWEFNGRWNEKEDYNFGRYEADAQAFDSIAYNAPYYLIVKSAGNNRASNGPLIGENYWRFGEDNKLYDAGKRPDSLSSNNSYGIIPTDANAKNLLTIGAVAGIPSGYAKKEDVLMPSFSSWGPTDDGRIKPDLVADGVSVLSSISTNDSSYGYSNGTSMSSPNAAGSLMLLQELSQQLSPKKFIRSATVKALAIHGANEAGLYAGPDYKFGWGLLNMSEAASVLKTALSSKNSASSVDLVYEKTLQNKQVDTFTIISSGIKPVKATLVWTDVKGTIAKTLNDTTSRLVNDLDLKITNVTTNYLPWTLNPNMPDNAAVRANNRLDNVEKIELDTTFVGKTYTITVSNKANLERGKQDYSLIISGAGGNAYCISTASSSTGTKIDSTSINNIQFGNSTTSRYIDNSKYYINGEVNGNLIVYLKLGSSDSSNATRFVKVFIDYNNNGIFEDTETAATSTALLNGVYKTTILLPTTLQVGNMTKLRIVVMETDNSSKVKACDAYAIGETQDYTLKIIKPSTDLSVTELINPKGSICNKAIQYVTVKLVNNGSTEQSNLPLNLVVKEGATTILDISEIFNGKLIGFESMNYTFQKPISIEANKTYTITATVNVTNDQLKNNNSLTNSFVSASAVAAPAGVANNCSNLIRLSVTNPNSAKSYFWYDSSNFTNPVGVGSKVTLNNANSPLYLKQGYQNFVGPPTNTSLGNTGSYNVFAGNFLKINATAPINLETTRFYTGAPGKIEVILGTLASINDSSYTYYVVQKTILNVGASSPIPEKPKFDTDTKRYIATPYVSGDSGKIYALNLSVPEAGEYILIVNCDSSSIFRNNALTTSTYPMGSNKIFSITGNNIQPSSGNYQNFYYYFYNTQISTNDCVSPTTIIPVQTAALPTITIKGDSITSSVAGNYQWYLNSNIIPGATNQIYKATTNGIYKVATSAGDCQTVSTDTLVLVRDPNGNVITGITESNPKEISLKISSNDNIDNLIKGNSFNIQFSKIQSQGIGLEIVNSLGSKVFQIENLSNQPTPQHITTPNLTTGIYFVKVYANKKVYVQRVFITNN